MNRRLCLTRNIICCLIILYILCACNNTSNVQILESPNPDVPLDIITGTYYLRNYKGDIDITFSFDGLGYVTVTDSSGTKKFAYSRWDEETNKLYFDKNTRSVEILDENTIQYASSRAYKENSDQDAAAINRVNTVHTSTGSSSTASAYDLLTIDEKKEICKYIQNQYDYYDKKEGTYTGDKYSDKIWKDVANKWGISEVEVSIIWQKYSN